MAGPIPWISDPFKILLKCACSWHCPHLGWRRTVKHNHMKNLYVFLFFLLSFFTVSAQDWTWGLKATGSFNAYGASSVAVNHRGDIVMAGHYQKDMALGSFTLPTADDYYTRIFMCRVNASHEVQWLQAVEDENGNYGDDLGLAIDDDQNIYLTGNTDGKIFVTKYDSLGKELWHNDLGGKSYGYGSAIALDQFDNVYVTGGGGWNFFMTKLDYNGKVVWTKDIWVNSSAGCYISDIQVDALGNIYFVGTFGIDKLPLDQFTITHGSGGTNIVFGKMNTEGKFVWVKSIGGYMLDSPSLELTPDGHLFLGGGFHEWMVLPETYIQGPCCNEGAPFIAKFKIDGTYEWAKTANSYYGVGMIHDISTDHEGNLYTSGGYFTCYGTFCTESDYYIEKYDKDGQNLWRKEFAMASLDIDKGIDIDNNGNLYLMAANQSATFIDPDTYANTITLGVGQFDTKASTYKKTPRPLIEKFFWKCTADETVQLTAKGQNIQWYTDAALTHKVHSGNTHTPNATTDTLYVTQTLHGIESWPKVVLVLGPISSKGLVLDKDSLIAPQNDFYTYQWYYKQDSIKNATNFFIRVDTTTQYENFSVVIALGKCVKSLKGSASLVTAVSPETPATVECFPNPTTGMVILRTRNGMPFTCQVVNTLGLEIANTPAASTTDGLYQIDLHDQPAGTYFIKIQADNTVHVTKVVKR